jgi:outer membrane protein assembly factor BamB
MKSLFVTLILLTVQSVGAADWLQFRGTAGAGKALDANPPVSWSQSENLKWQAQLPGPGSSSPIVVGDRVFVTCWSGYGDGSDGSVGDLKRHLVCVDRASGKILWNKTISGSGSEDAFKGYITEHGYASQSPASDGQRVYAYFGKSGVHAFDLDGKKLWSKDVGSGSNSRRWGSGTSVMVHEDAVIVTAADESRSIYSFDKLTGKMNWKSAADSLDLSFGTPIPVTVNGQTSLVIGVPNELWGLNPASGKLRWLAETGIPGNVTPTVVQSDAQMFVFGGYPRRSTVAVKKGGKGDVTDTHVSWRITKTTYVPTPVHHDGHLYFVNDQGFAFCLNSANGEIVYEQRLPNLNGRRPVYAATVMTKNHYYAVTRRSGTFVIDLSPNFKVVATNKIANDDTQFNATPAISGNDLFIRSDRALYRLTDTN